MKDKLQEFCGMILKSLIGKYKRLENFKKQIWKNWRDVYWWKFNIIQLYFRIKGNKGIRVMYESWDNLIILDACRYDFFKEVVDRNEDYRISCGSSTPEFLIKNFANTKFYDTVYITANPYVDRLVKNSFYRVISVWKTGWDDKLNTVMPETVVKYAIDAEKKYPDKRLIIHFMQPHIPFIKDPEFTNYNLYKRFKVIEKGTHIPPIETPWTRAFKGELEISEVWKAYKRNLEVVVPYA